MEIMRNEIGALKELLHNRYRAVGKQGPDATPDAWLTEWFKGEYRTPNVSSADEDSSPAAR